MATYTWARTVIIAAVNANSPIVQLRVTPETIPTGFRAHCLGLSEIAISARTAVASDIILCKTATLGTANATVYGIAEQGQFAAADPAHQAARVVTTWTVAPTIPSPSLDIRGVLLPDTIGANVSWVYDEINPPMINPFLSTDESIYQSLILWNRGGSACAELEVTFRWSLDQRFAPSRQQLADLVL